MGKSKAESSPGNGFGTAPFYYLPLSINKLASVFLFVDDTSILVMDKNHCALKCKVAGTLSHIANWFSS
jgi:hypothetical protein